MSCLEIVYSLPSLSDDRVAVYPPADGELIPDIADGDRQTLYGNPDFSIKTADAENSVATPGEDGRAQAVSELVPAGPVVGACSFNRSGFGRRSGDSCWHLNRGWRRDRIGQRCLGRLGIGLRGAISTATGNESTGSEYQHRHEPSRPASLHRASLPCPHGQTKAVVPRRLDRSARGYYYLPLGGGGCAYSDHRGTGGAGAGEHGVHIGRSGTAAARDGNTRGHGLGYRDADGPSRRAAYSPPTAHRLSSRTAALRQQAAQPVRHSGQRSGAF